MSSNSIGTTDVEEAAENAAGNWEKFHCFVWFREQELEDPQQWAVFYTKNRDSGLLAESNASVIERELDGFAAEEDPDVVWESHDHWACGHVDGFSVRVYDADGEITPAFRKYHELMERLADYPILDEEDYTQRECDATYENIGQAAWSVKGEYELPESWQDEVYSWLSEHRSRAVENRDDQGGWPEEADLRYAFRCLDYPKVEG